NYSYTNLAMLMSSIPSYDPEKQKKKEISNMEIKNINEIRGLL
ncbi:unnamed protein product, partial [marine sediment metagenome]